MAGSIAEIQEMFVKSEKRSAGVGKKLVHALTQMAQQKGVIQIEVTTNNDRVMAHQFYER